MMTQLAFEVLLKKACKKRGVKPVLADPEVKKDEGYAIGDEVHLPKKCSCQSIYRAIAFHELAHAIINKEQEKLAESKQRLKGIDDSGITVFREETKAWDLAQKLCLECTGKPFSKKMGEFMVKCLKTYATEQKFFRKHYS